MEYRALLDRLQDGRFRKLHLSQKALRARMKESGFLAGLPATLGARRVRCSEVLSWCQPVMDALCPPPEGGWLLCCYEELAHRLFPDPQRRPIGQSEAQAMEFYLTVLDFFLETEAGRCPHDPLSDIPSLTEAELSCSLIRDEYERFCRAIAASRFVTLMRLGRETMPFDPASHPIGVHSLALHMARQAKMAGMTVDVPLVSAASLAHGAGPAPDRPHRRQPLHLGSGIRKPEPGIPDPDLCGFSCAGDPGERTGDRAHLRSLRELRHDLLQAL